jgi:hypothetical protein
MAVWRSFPPRQITGKPMYYYGYIGRERAEEHCCARGMHRGAQAAIRCAKKAAKSRNRGVTCCARVTYETANSSVSRPNGEPRYFDGAQCQNRIQFVDKDGDGWCWVHARNPHNIENYGPFEEI